MGAQGRIAFWLLAVALVQLAGNAGELPAKDTPHLDHAVELIRNRVGWFGPRPNQYSREFLYTVASMNYVQSRVSPLEYALLVRKRKKLPAEPEEYLAMRAGICGGQVMTVREILSRLGVRNRPVAFYLHGAVPAKNQSHIGVEVFYSRQWHYFDITWGTFFRRDGAKTDAVLPLSAVLKTKGVLALAVTNRSDLWFQQYTAAGLNPFAYLHAAEKDVLVGNHGTVRLRPTKLTKQSSVYTPTHQPNYIGRNSRSADSGALSFRLLGVGAKLTKCTIAITGLAGSGLLVIRGKSGQTQTLLSELKLGNHTIDIAGLQGDSLSIAVVADEPLGIGYVVIKQISLQ